MPRFKLGTHINKIRKRKNRTLQKYIRIGAGPQRGEYVHRMIVAARIGRPLTDEEEIDHKDGNTLNNDPSNLSDPMSAGEHTQIENERRRRKREEAICKDVQVVVLEMPRLPPEIVECHKQMVDAISKATSISTDFIFGANEK